jgi:lipopolysaccharide/colanic/teichoic acid biosynthesis glycosyltransferase
MKRVIDLVLATAALILCAPLMVIAALTIMSTMGRPIFFRQRRAGLHGVPFTVVKFRTMKGASIVGREGIDDAARLSRAGRFLRRTSIDELPQLFNVIRGDMSLVGPRPLLVEYLPLYSAEQARRHAMKPGITGWAQVRGRNVITWPERLRLDVWYVDHWSVTLDEQILLTTILAVVRGSGVSPAGQVSMDRFTGNGPDEPETRSDV